MQFNTLFEKIQKNILKKLKKIEKLERSVSYSVASEPDVFFQTRSSCYRRWSSWERKKNENKSCTCDNGRGKIFCKCKAVLFSIPTNMSGENWTSLAKRTHDEFIRISKNFELRDRNSKNYETSHYFFVDLTIKRRKKSLSWAQKNYSRFPSYTFTARY